MTRWEFITSDEYITTGIELIVRSGLSVKEMREELNEKFLQYRDELLHGKQEPGGCKDENCKVCYRYPRAGWDARLNSRYASLTLNSPSASNTILYEKDKENTLLLLRSQMDMRCRERN